MTDPFIGEIQIFGFPYAPYQWAICNGALLQVRQNPSLFSLIGTAYGGNGTQTFGLPNLLQQSVGGQGSGPALTPRVMGEAFGAQSVGLMTAEMPAHNHTMGAYFARAGANVARRLAPQAGDYLTSNASSMYLGNPPPPPPPAPPPPPPAPPAPNTMLSPGMLQNAGGSVPHENRQPLLALNYSIAMAGPFPSFS